jgi:hypothetical protein
MKLFYIALCVLFLFLGLALAGNNDDEAGPSNRPDSPQKTRGESLDTLLDGIVECQQELKKAKAELAKVMEVTDNPTRPGAYVEASKASQMAELKIRLHTREMEMLMSQYNHMKNKGSYEGGHESSEDDVPSSRAKERRRGKRPVVEEEEQHYGSRKIERILPRPTDGFMDKSKDGKVHKLREAQFNLLNYLFLILFVLLDEADRSSSGDSDRSATAKVGHFPDYEHLKRELEKDSCEYSVRHLIVFGLRKIYEEAFALSIRHEHGTEAEQAFRGDAISGCDKTLGPTKRAEKAIKKARAEAKVSSSKTTATPKRGAYKPRTFFRGSGRAYWSPGHQPGSFGFTVQQPQQ